MLNRKGLLLVVSGPSGAGKGTICKALLNKNDQIKLSVSATTRKPRNGEVHGVNYFFIEKEEFTKMIENGEFLEHAQIYDNFYGTPKAAIIECLEKGQDVILEIEMQGARQIKEVYPEGVFIFVLPPSLEELKSRIVGRGTETQEEIEKRFSCAFEEINQIVNYDYFIVNEDIEKSVNDVEAIISAEKNKVTRYKNNIIDKFKEEL
ncbi:MULTISPECIES: guanylate kinase [Romboutsia]|jgi:guanylate kinase|uniref:Guanylate kinase n=1 Tax=Romboutsia ilealis TaxID=1115758 RepID=A0A1V1I360_9FIRM|nr:MULTISPECIES: guanylate kinase [Romboutsia]MCI9060741.1 guanylate kinase [Romboutsia sp.]MCI9259353.1 guanylate kinase [Romboutsia sp.]CED94559.1 Guanylate kinase [Romboutsia ilealis]